MRMKLRVGAGEVRELRFQKKGRPRAHRPILLLVEVICGQCLWVSLDLSQIDNRKEKKTFNQERIGRYLKTLN
jgi:hypothetical protein